MDPHDSRREKRRKDRLIQTRVPEDLESTLKREARRRRLTVSHLIRNILEDTFQLVDDVVANVDEIVTDSVELAKRVGRDARRVADAVRDVVGEPPAAAPVPEAGASPDPDAPGDDIPQLAHVDAWNRVILNRQASCARCGTDLSRGSDAFVGLSEDASRPRIWLCVACGSSL